MSALKRQPQADPLFARPVPERPAYATGMLLGARDFEAEQTYHRGRLARALAQRAGNGTLAGLEVSHVPPASGDAAPQAEEIRVEPGVAVDRLGRLIELTRPACIRLDPWFAAEADRDAGSTLRQGAHLDAGRFVSTRRRSRPRAADATALPPRLAEAVLPAADARAVVADVYLRFVACEAALAPAFAGGPYDALDSVAASRLRDAWELSLVVRRGLTDAQRGWPDPGVDLAAIADADARRDALQDALLAAYPADGRAGSRDALAPLPEHALGVDTSAVYLARVLIPVGLTDPPARVGTAVVVDNWSRRFLPPADLLARWLDASRID